MGFFIDDDECIYMCRKGNELAWQLLQEKYKAFIYSWIDSAVTTYRYLSLSRDELYQSMLLVWHDAVEAYQEEYGLFYSYAKLCVTRDLISFLRQETSDQSKKVNRSYSLDEPISESEGTTYGDLLESHYWSTSPTATYEVNETWERIENVIDEQLSEQERQVFYLQQDGIDYEEIAARLHISKKKVDNLLQKIKRHIKERIECE